MYDLTVFVRLGKGSFMHWKVLPFSFSQAQFRLEKANEGWIYRPMEPPLGLGIDISNVYVRQDRLKFRAYIS